jgi:predicted ATPase
MKFKPYLVEIRLDKEKIKNWEKYPFSIPVIRSLHKITLKSNLCFFVGENGSGKSTLLEAIAQNYGFGKEGGSKNISFQTTKQGSNTDLETAIKLSWSRKILSGYFFRAESFFNIASYLDELKKEYGGSATYEAYGGTSLHEKSHGEAFISLFENRFSHGGFFILDEPEAALSPQRQLRFLVILHELLKLPNTQLIIATHSPILLACPDAQILNFDSGTIKEVNYKETEAYQILYTFMKNTEKYLERLFKAE